ncbi:hypothetical protein [Streptomyces cyaneofuscatus]|uniref:hypothetical protein n=1 Tax=Streptomyces cyaneofuscatus TaxID=66883 RepID=UPI00369D1547
MKPPTTAAESLAGLIRVRPHGWLASPLPADPTAVAGLLHRARTAHDLARAAEPMRVLSARATAAVAELGDPPRCVLKLHADRNAYLQETLAYTLLGNSPALPALLGADDATSSLLIEHIPHSVDFRQPGAAADLIDTVVAVHTAPAMLDATTSEAFAAFRLDRPDLPVPAWIRDPGAWAAVIDLCQAAYGGARIPVGHLDLKPEHLRLRTDGHPVLCDIETVRPDVTGLIDLVTLPAVLRQAGIPLPGPAVRDLYQQAARRHGLNWTTPALRSALNAYRAATGLATLHTLAD